MNTPQLILRSLTLALLVGITAPSTALGESPTKAEEAAAQNDAEAARLRDMMDKRARKSAWGGVESAYIKLRELGIELTADDHARGAEAARNLGDSWSAYQRLVMTIQIDDERPEAHDAMRVFRDGYGRLTVRRVEATPIKLAKPEMPFQPDERSSVEYAAIQLTETGGFDGLLPIGAYTIGDKTVEITAGLKPLVVQREKGDGGK